MICDNLTVSPSGHLLFAGQDTVELAKQYGTPLYLMDEDRIRHNCRVYTQAFRKHFGPGARPLYASKANSFKRIYEIMKEEGMGIDVVSSGEIYTALQAGYDLGQAYFHSNNKTDEDIRYSMEHGIGYFVADNVEEIKAIEEAYAKTETPVVSNNSAHRWTPDVPMVVPELNPEHFEVIASQKKRLVTTRGFVAVKPNCSIQSYAPVLTAWKEFEPYEVVATTYQAISGAGKTFKDWPEMNGNIIPYIGGEEEKSEQEPLRLWGHIENGEIVKADSPVITTQCIRVPVLNGHTAAVFVKFRKKPTKEQLIEKLTSFSGLPQELGLPSAPKQMIQYLEEDDRPQVSLDVDYENGMGISVGRLREDTVYDYKFVGLSHNTLRGAAGGAVLCAETLKAKGYITKK